MVDQVQTKSKFQSLVIVMVVLIGTMSDPGSCGRIKPRKHERRNVTESQCLHRIRHRYLLVENTLHPSNNGAINFVTGAKEGSKYCPWTWAIDEDVDRIPRYLAKANCTGCGIYCRAVFYSHNSLVQRCTQKAGGPICIWRRMQRTLAIAYVYDP